MMCLLHFKWWWFEYRSSSKVLELIITSGSQNQLLRENLLVDYLAISSLILLLLHSPSSTMLFAPFAVALVASMSTFGVVTHGKGPRNANQMAGFDMQYIDVETGLIKSWKGASEEDTKQLKTMIE
jgi:hypothetical protein